VADDPAKVTTLYLGPRKQHQIPEYHNRAFRRIGFLQGRVIWGQTESPVSRSAIARSAVRRNRFLDTDILLPPHRVST